MGRLLLCFPPGDEGAADLLGRLLRLGQHGGRLGHVRLPAGLAGRLLLGEALLQGAGLPLRLGGCALGVVGRLGGQADVLGLAPGGLRLPQKNGQR
ncbi:hypothetical protein [Streptomyces californicus]|uniref:hypothetical protein n=1 Tax=Streptomyces californicus TaxID=67351 RepID=UPI0033C7D86B